MTSEEYLNKKDQHPDRYCDVNPDVILLNMSGGWPHVVTNLTEAEIYVRNYDVDVDENGTPLDIQHPALQQDFEGVWYYSKHL